MSGCVGGCLACVGVLKMFDVLTQGVEYLKRDIGPRPNDNKVQADLPHRCMHSISSASSAVAIGNDYYWLYAVYSWATNAFLGALNQAIGVSLPYFAGALAL